MPTQDVGLHALVSVQAHSFELPLICRQLTPGLLEPAQTPDPHSTPEAIWAIRAVGLWEHHIVSSGLLDAATRCQVKPHAVRERSVATAGKATKGSKPFARATHRVIPALANAHSVNRTAAATFCWRVKHDEPYKAIIRLTNTGPKRTASPTLNIAAPRGAVKTSQAWSSPRSQGSAMTTHTPNTGKSAPANARATGIRLIARVTFAIPHEAH